MTTMSYTWPGPRDKGASTHNRLLMDWFYNLLTRTNGNGNLYLYCMLRHEVLYNDEKVALLTVSKTMKGFKTWYKKVYCLLIWTSWCKFLQNLSCIVCVCVMCREYRSGSQGGEGSRDREYPLSRQKSEEGSLPPSRHNSRPPTRSGSRPSTADSLCPSISGWIIYLPNICVIYQYINTFDSSKISKK